MSQATHRNQHGRAWRERTVDLTKQAIDNGAKRAKSCLCPEPVTYRDEDGELRCTCGRAVAP